MKLVVGLGNPDKIYENTRHNIGFEIIDSYAKSKKLTIEKNKFNGLYEIYDFKEDKVILLKPQSYMNLSGEVVRKFKEYFKIEIQDILIISDDLDMNFGNIRLRSHGTSGGHNGLKNIEQNLQTQEYKRLKIGISNNKTIDTKDYVLGKLSKEEKNKLDGIKNITNKIIDDFLIQDFDKIMNIYN